MENNIDNAMAFCESLNTYVSSRGNVVIEPRDLHLMMVAYAKQFIPEYVTDVIIEKMAFDESRDIKELGDRIAYRKESVRLFKLIRDKIFNQNNS